MSFSEYQAHGWSLCAIDRGKKAPTYADWNSPEKVLTEEEAMGADGAGLMHALSGTCAIDIDDVSLARPWLAKHGVDLDALQKDPAMVGIVGRPGRMKFLYRMKLPMRTLKPKDSGLELRSATAEGMSVQDVLPPSIHPITKKAYVWKYGDPLLAHWSNPPPIPANVLAMWRELAAITPVEKGAQHAPRIEASRETIRKAMYQRIKIKKLDVSNHDDWLQVGMALHDQTGGAQDGLELWDEWSATDKSLRDDGTPRYQGIDALKTRYVSFSSAPGKNVVSLASDVLQLPAEKEEFAIETEEDEEETTQEKMKKQAELKIAEAKALLEKRLVFVRNLEKYFDTERHRVILTDNGLRHQFQYMMPRRARGKLDPVELLRDSGTRRFVDGLGFHPGEGATFKYKGDIYANSYRNRLPEPCEPTARELEKIEWLFGRITDVSYRDWLVQFYAHVVQFPGIKIKSAPLIWSDIQGNGKTTLTKVVPALLVGEEYSQDVTSGLLESPHNDYLTGKWHIYLDEFRAGSRGERQAISKKVEIWIANDTVAMNPKGLPGYTTPNHFFVTASSNDDDAASISNQDRKWAILELLAKQMTPTEVKWLYHDFLLGPRAAGVLRHYFLNQPILDFVASAAAPKTESRQAMVASALPPDVEALTIAAEEHSGIFSREVVLVQEAQSFIHKHTTSRPSVDRVGKILARAPFNAICQRIRVGENRYRVAILKNHAKWQGANGRAIMAHIEGLDDDVERELTDEELLA